MFKNKFLFLILSIFLVSSTSAWCDTSTKTNNATQSTKQYISDTTITTKVKAELLANKHISSLSISVATDKGVVTLTGNVNNAMQKKIAAKVASKVKGVKSVQDELMIKTKSTTE
jgi:hyperosmotically inducible protein